MRTLESRCKCKNIASLLSSRRLVSNLLAIRIGRSIGLYAA